MTRNILPLLFAATVFLAGTVLAQAPAANPKVLIKTSEGDITLELFPAKAPITVKNILDYVEADKGCVLVNETIWCTGNPHEILNGIREHGYEGCLTCQR